MSYSRSRIGPLAACDGHWPLVKWRVQSLLLAIAGAAVFAVPAPAQQAAVTISGFITDAESGESLVSATVYEANTGTGAVANQYGFYSLTVPPDSVRLVVQHLGYETAVIRMRPSADVKRDISLRARAVALDAIDVIAPAGTDYVDQTLMSTIKLPVEQVRKLPVLLGETDIIKTIQLLPGVQSGVEGASGLYVRGGGPDQNLVLLDGTPVYNTNHLFGFLSVFNGDAIKDITLIKGGFPARYGGRLSSVVDMTMKEGNLKKFSGKGVIGLVSTRFTLEGPIKKDRASFLISGRRTIYDLLIYPFLPSDSKGGLYFFDLNAKANYIVSDRDRVYLSFYSGGTHFGSRGKSSRSGYTDENRWSLGWGNVTGTLRWNHVFGPRVFANTSVGYSRYGLEVFMKTARSSVAPNPPASALHRLRYSTDIQDLSLSSDVELAPNPRHYVRLGGAFNLQSFHPGVLQERLQDGDAAPVDTSLSAEEAMRGVTLAAYVEDDMQIFGRLQANIGVRAAAFLIDGTRFTSVEPRVGLRFRLSTNTVLKASYARMQQNVHLLAGSNGLSLPTDLWVSATRDVPPQKAWQAAAGLAYRFGQRRYNVTLEGYYKEMRDVIDYRDGEHYFSVTGEDWEGKIASGRGSSYGAELFVQRAAGRLTGWVGYTLSWSDRTFAELNRGKTFPFAHDRRHDASVAVTYRLRPRMELSASWVYGTGRSVWLPTGHFPVQQHGPAPPGALSLHTVSGILLKNAYIYGPRNSSRLPAEHRLDLAVHLHREGRRTRRTLSLGVYNAYNRKNPFVLRLEEEQDGSLVFKKISVFQLIPSVSYQISF